MAKRKLVEAVVVATETMLWGSLGAVYRRCGKPTCHCATGGEKHGPVFYLTRGEHGHTRNIYVPDELRDEVAAGVAAYRRYRSWDRRSRKATRGGWAWKTRRSGGGDDHA